MSGRDMSKVIYMGKDKWFKEGMKNTSHSQIECYSSCSLKWALQKVFKIEEPWSVNLAFGQVYHECVEALLKLADENKSIYDASVEYLTKVIMPTWEKAFSEEFAKSDLEPGKFKETQEMSKDAVPVMIDYFKSNRFELVKIKGADGNMIPAMEFGVAVPIERPFDKSLREDYYLLLFPDAVVRDKTGKVIILDHKTSSRKYSEFKLKSSNQLPLYVYGLKDLFKENGIQYDNWVGYDVIIKGKKLAVEYYDKQVTGDSILKMLTHINMALDGMQKKSFCATNSDMTCEYLCGYTEICHGKDRDKFNFKDLFTYMNDGVIITGKNEEANNESGSDKNDSIVGW